MDVDTEAREQGWKPEAEWKGDPPSGGFKSAEQFVKDGEHIPGILKSKISSLEERVDALTQTNAEFKQFTDKQIDAEKKKTAELIGELESVKAQAITDGDGLAVVKAEKDIKSLETSPEVPVENPMGDKWGEANPWYNSNKRLTGYADGIFQQIIDEGYTGKAYFNELTRRVKEEFPEEFENPARKQAAGVEKGGNRDAGGNDESWENLPAADRAKAERFIRDMPDFTKEQFLEQYEW